jgi:hypothetical protein
MAMYRQRLADEAMTNNALVDIATANKRRKPNGESCSCQLSTLLTP